MKKLNILLAGLVALGLTACDDKSDLGVMQTNPQEAIMATDGVEIAYGSGIAGDAISLPQYENQNVPVVTLVKAEDLPEGAVINYVMQVASDENFANHSDLAVTDGAVKANDWEEAVLKLIGKTPEPVNMWVRFAVYADSSADHVRIGGPDFYMGTKKISVTPYDLNLPIEAAYYLVIDGAEPVKMDHSSKHQYDDPNFTYIIDVPAAGCTWVIVPESQLNAGNTDNCYGVSETGDPAAAEGGLALMNDGGQTGMIGSAGPHKISVNMLDLSYSVNIAIDYIYTTGPANSWSFGDDNMLLFTDNYVDYHGFVYVEDRFKMTGQPDWSPLDWGGKDGELVPGGPNIELPTGLYWVAVNLNEATYETTAITAIGMIGGFNGWGGDVEMTTSDYKTYTGTLELTEGTQFKFRCNNDWAINLGGEEGNLVPNAGNLEISEAGTYEVTLSLGHLPYSCTIVKK